ncbi:MAG: PhnD/SsuA/transferrin family substrate-binding protein [Oricola sp.]
MIATLSMYDWPEHRAQTDARWARLRDTLRAEGFDAPDRLTRADNPLETWLAPDLLLGETCSHPLATVLAGRVRYVATPVHRAPGCGFGTYRSAIIRNGPESDMPAPRRTLAARFEADAVAGRLAANSADSMSGIVALTRDLHARDMPLPAEDAVLWTGSHRASIRAVANGEADYATIDCVTWAIAKEHESAAKAVHVAGWTASRPGLPLITSLGCDDEALMRIRRAVLAAIPAVVLARPFEVSPRPDRRPAA